MGWQGKAETDGYVWKLSAHSVTPLRGGNNDGAGTFLESHVLRILQLSPFLDTPIWGKGRCAELARSQLR